MRSGTLALRASITLASHLHPAHFNAIRIGRCGVLKYSVSAFSSIGSLAGPPKSPSPSPDRKSNIYYTPVEAADSKRGLSRKERQDLRAEAYRPPMTLADKQAEQDLRRSARPVDVLRRCIDDGNASPHVVRLCLEAQWSAQASIPRQRRERILAAQRKDGLAQLILMQMLNDFPQWISFLGWEVSAVGHLCYFAAVEGLEAYMLDLLFVTTSESTIHWRTGLFQGMIAAEHMLDTRGSANRLLEIFFKVTDTIADKRKERALHPTNGENHASCGILTMDTEPALLRTFSCLTDRGSLFGTHRTSPALYDRFMDHYQQAMSKRLNHREAKWGLSRALLFHPVSLDAGPALDLLRDYAYLGPDVFTSQRAWVHDSLDSIVASFIRRTAEVAEASGNWEAAVWVFKTFEKQFLTVKPMDMRHARGQVRSLGVPPTPIQQRLFTAATRVGGLLEKPRPETVQVDIQLR